MVPELSEEQMKRIKGKGFKGIEKATPYQPTKEEMKRYENLEKGFNLSEKITTGFNISASKALMAEDVKEFISRLKNELRFHGVNLTEIIDKLAGEDLI